MFSGIIEERGTVAANRIADQGRLVLRTPLAGSLTLGASVSVNGCCLSVVEQGEDEIAVDVMPESARRTTIGTLTAGDAVNLEAALRLGDVVGGHLVTGHVDGVAQVVSTQDEGNSVVVTLRAAHTQVAQMVSKGSVALDGISLTLIDVGADTFSVALIPITRERTSAGQWAAGSRVNLETDLIAKQVERSVTQLLREPV
jgi:riboflavin synthase